MPGRSPASLERRRESSRQWHQRQKEIDPDGYKQMVSEISSRAYRKRGAERNAERNRMKHIKRMQDPEKVQERNAKRAAQARAQRRMKRSPEEVYRLISKALPTSLPRHVRDDIISAMCLCVIEGRLLIDNIKKEAKNFITAQNRAYDTFKTVSLDAPIPGTDITYIDRLAAE